MSHCWACKYRIHAAPTNIVMASSLVSVQVLPAAERCSVIVCVNRRMLTACVYTYAHTHAHIT